MNIINFADHISHAKCIHYTVVSHFLLLYSFLNIFLYSELLSLAILHLCYWDYASIFQLRYDHLPLLVQTVRNFCLTFCAVQSPRNKSTLKWLRFVQLQFRVRLEHLQTCSSSVRNCPRYKAKRMSPECYTRQILAPPSNCLLFALRSRMIQCIYLLP